MDELSCKFDELAKLKAEFVELDKLNCQFDELVMSTTLEFHKLKDKFDKLDEFDDFGNVNCKFNELDQLRMSSMSWMS